MVCLSKIILCIKYLLPSKGLGICMMFLKCTCTKSHVTKQLMSYNLGEAHNIHEQTDVNPLSHWVRLSFSQTPVRGTL